MLPFPVIGFGLGLVLARCAGPLGAATAAYGYAAEHGAKVVNLSLGSSSSSRAERDAIAAFPSMLVVAAAGNGGAESSVDLAAPGVSIASTWVGGGYSWSSGTSMATPHVSGAALGRRAGRAADRHQPFSARGCRRPPGVHRTDSQRGPPERPALAAAGRRRGGGCARPRPRARRLRPGGSGSPGENAPQPDVDRGPARQ